MKRYLTIMLLLFAFMGAKAEDIPVSTAAEFRDAVTNHPTACIKLKADIDLSSIGTVTTTFRGIIDGEEITIDSENNEVKVFHSLGTSSKRTKHPIFKTIEGARFRNLIIRNFRLEWDDDDIGAVACTARGCQFNQIVVAEVSVFNDDDEAGAIVGKAENCDFRNVRGMGNDVTVDGNRAGGFVGLSYNSIYCDCSNSAYSTVYSDGSWGVAYAGGFVGESNSDQFVFCINFAAVGGLDDRIGGIVGYSSMSYFTNCSNSGCIMHCEESDFINTTNAMKKAMDEQLTDAYLASIQADLEKHYEKQNFNLKTAFITFVGMIYTGIATFGVEIALMSLMSGGLAPFVATITVIVAGFTTTIISLIDATIGAHDEIGGIAGGCNGTAFNTCANYGTLLCRDSGVGGIAGELDGDPASKGNSFVNCLNAGKVQGANNIGGIVGFGSNLDRIDHCLNVGELICKGTGGKCNPIIGDGSMTTLNKNYYLSDKYDNTQIEKIPVTATMLKDGSVAGLLNDGSENGLWHQSDEYPVPDPSCEEPDLKELNDVFVISSLKDLDALRTAVNNGLQDTYTVYISEDIDCGTDDWEPIGTTANPFMGTCYGGGHTISNLNINGISTDGKSKNGLGFFGVAGINTIVRDLTIGSGSINGGNSLGAIIGFVDHKAQTPGYIKIIGCGNKASITGDYDCGGLVGGIYSNSEMKLTIDNSYNMGAITANSKSSALCGFGKKGATITGCWNSGEVNVKTPDAGMLFARGENTTNITVQNCYNLDSDLGQTGVTAFTAAEAKNGVLCLGLNGHSNDASVGLPWAQDIASGAEYPSYVGYSNDKNAIYTSREIKNNCGTVVLPYTVQSDDFIQYYVLGDVTDNTVNFTAVETLEAGTPAIFRVVKADTTYNFISSDYVFGYEVKPATVSDWKMNGNLDASLQNMVFTDATQLKSLYYISGDQIKGAKNSLTIAPFRAFLDGPARGTGTALNITFDGNDATGIQLVPVETHDDGSVSYGLFNLAGQRLDSLQPGVNIVNGKKVFIK